MVNDDPEAAEMIDLMRWTTGAWQALIRNERAATAREVRIDGKVQARTPDAHAAQEARDRRIVFEKLMKQAMTSKSGTARSGLRRLRARYRESSADAMSEAGSHGAVPAEFDRTREPGAPVGRDRDAMLALSGEMLAELLGRVYYENERLPPVEVIVEMIVLADAISAARIDGTVTVATLHESIDRAHKAYLGAKERSGASGARFDAMEIVGSLAGDLAAKTVERAIKRAWPDQERKRGRRPKR